MKIGSMGIAHVSGRRGTVDITMNIILEDLIEDELLVLIKSPSCMEGLPHEAKEL